MKKHVSAKCCKCGKACEVRPLKDGSPALAPGWQVFGEDRYCDVCRKACFVMRSFALPIWSARPDEGESTQAAWFRFLDAFRVSSMQAAQVGTWAMRELAKLDNKPVVFSEVDGKKKAKLPKMEADKLYGTSRLLFPELDSQSLGSVLQRAKSKYRETRFGQRVKFDIGLPKYGFPAPVPIPFKDANVEFDAEDNLWLSVRVSGKRFDLRLARGAEHHRSHKAIRLALADKARFGEVQLTAKKNERGGLTDLMARLAIEVPIVKHERTNLMIVKTHADRLWTVQLEGRDTEWNLNEDHVRGIIIAHKRRLQRLSEDAKMERRIGRKEINSVRDRVSEKYNRRMADFCHKASAMAVGFAVRNQVAEIQYNETKEKFVNEFPWFKLAAMVEQKAKANGITFEKIADSGESIVA